MSHNSSLLKKMRELENLKKKNFVKQRQKLKRKSRYFKMTHWFSNGSTATTVAPFQTWQKSPWGEGQKTQSPGPALP